MNFYSYMVRNYKGDGTPERDLANTMRKDRERFPRNSNHKLKAWGKLMFEYVMRYPDIYEGHTDTFKRCWEDYVKCEKSKLSSRS